MKYFNNKNRNNSKVTATATLLLVGTILVVATVSTAPLGALASRLGGEEETGAISIPILNERKAPTVVSGDNIYIAWWTNNTENGNEEVMFRASTDAGATFSNSTNLSNTTDADSWRAEIAGEGDTVVVSWWETNRTSDVPVARISTDAGETFGPMIMLGMNGTVSGVEEEEATEEGEGEEEEVTAEGVIEEAVE